MWRGRGKGRKWGYRGPPWTPSLPPASIDTILAYTRIVSIEPRRTIIDLLSTGEKSTGEIASHLEARGIILPRTTLYYHLGELENAGIIEHKGYRETGSGAPEKVWSLKMRKICIDLANGTLSFE